MESWIKGKTYGGAALTTHGEKVKSDKITGESRENRRVKAKER